MKGRKKKAIVILVIAVAAVGGASVALRVRKASKGQSGPAVSTAPVVRETIEKRLSEKAALEGTESVEVVSQLHAQVLSIQVKEGDKVSKGQLLATLDSSDISKELRLSQNTVDLQRQQLSESLTEKQKTYQEAVSARDQAQAAVEQAQALFAGGAGTEQALRDAREKLETAQRAVDGSVRNGESCFRRR